MLVFSILADKEVGSQIAGPLAGADRKGGEIW